MLCSHGSHYTLLTWLSTHFTYCLPGPVKKAASVEQALKLFTKAEVCVREEKEGEKQIGEGVCVCVCVLCVLFTKRPMCVCGCGCVCVCIFKYMI
jgi:hypothetical protein